MSGEAAWVACGSEVAPIVWVAKPWNAITASITTRQNASRRQWPGGFQIRVGTRIRRPRGRERGGATVATAPSSSGVVSGAGSSAVVAMAGAVRGGPAWG